MQAGSLWAGIRPKLITLLIEPQSDFLYTLVRSSKEVER